MSKEKNEDAEMLDEYDFSNAVVGKYAKQYGEGISIVVVEQAGSKQSYGAHVPDLPGCVAVAETKEEVLDLIQEAIEFHPEGLREDGHC